MHLWSRNDKFAFLGVVLAAVGLACALFGQEIRRGLGLEAPQSLSQSSILKPATAMPANKQPSHDPEPAAVVEIRVGGDGNTISLDASSAVDLSQDYEVGGSGAHDDFTLGPKQTAHVALVGDGNTIRVAPELAGRVTIADNGDRNKVTH